MKKLILIACIVLASITGFCQIEFDSFTDGNITASPAWGGNTASWNIMPSSDVAGGAPGSFTLRLWGQNPSGTVYLSTPIYNWSVSQEWGIFMGRRTHAATTSDQSYFWLYANEANLNSATVDGYRIAYGDDLANDHIRLEYIVDGAVSSTVITSTGTTANGINYFGFLVRVKRSAVGVWELFTSVLPQVSGTGSNANMIPNAANTPVNQGTGTENSIVPAANGYFGIGALYSVTGNYSQQFDQVYLTAAPANSPVISISPSRVDSLIAVIGSASPAKSYVVEGVDLINDIVIPGTYGEFEFSLSNSPFIPTTSNITLTPVAGVVSPTTIYVRFVGYSFFPLPVLYEQIPLKSSGAATKNLEVTGIVIALEPTMQSTISFGTKTSNSIVVNFTGGNGTYKLLVAKESSPVDAEPQDAHSYYSGAFGSGSQLGIGNYVVPTTTFSSTVVTGLTPGKTYYFAVFNYNIGDNPIPPHTEEQGTENYLVPGATGSATTLPLVPLPILINYFKGTKQVSKHLLNWKVTCISTPRVTMLLERSADSRNFTGINSITADAVRCNQPFDYTDVDPLKGMNYYRLKNTDADGKITYSSIVALLNAVKGFEIISIAPNPVVADNFKLNVASAQAGKMEIIIFDMQGRLVNRQSILLIAGFNSLPVNVATLSSGTYTIKGSMADEQTRIMRFVKQ